MKKIIFYVIGIVSILGIVGYILVKINTKIDTSFADSITLRYTNNTEIIEVTVQSVEDIKAIAHILQGNTHRDQPSCGFSKNIALTFTGNGKVLTVYPANDHCPKFRIEDTNQYLSITKESYEELMIILDRYNYKIVMQ